jgi:hypothetical protein
MTLMTDQCDTAALFKIVIAPTKESNPPEKEEGVQSRDDNIHVFEWDSLPWKCVCARSLRLSLSVYYI